MGAGLPERAGNGHRARTPGPDRRARRRRAALGALFMQAHIAGARGVSGLVSAASFQTLQTSVVSDYDMGWGTQTFPTLGVAGVSHGGTTGRWFSLGWLAPSVDTGLMVVTNGGGERGAAALQELEALMANRIIASP